MLGSGLAVLLFWQVGGQIGLAAGAALPDPETTLRTWGLDFAFPAIFLALALSFVRTSYDWLPVAAAATGSIIYYLVIPADSRLHDLYIIVGAGLGCGVAALIYRPAFDPAQVGEPDGGPA